MATFHPGNKIPNSPTAESKLLLDHLTALTQNMAIANNSLPKKIREFCLLVSEVSNSENTFEALLDSGSAISIMKKSVYLSHFPGHKLLEDEKNLKYGGVNKSPIDVQGILHVNICLRLLPHRFFEVKFFVVPDSTMIYEALLGRDFITKSGLLIVLGPNLSVTCNEEAKEKISHEWKNEMEEMFQGFRKKGENEMVEFEMEIKTRQKKSLHFATREFSEIDKVLFRKVRDNLLSSGLVRVTKNLVFDNYGVFYGKKHGEIGFKVNFGSLNRATIEEYFLKEVRVSDLIEYTFFTILVLKDNFNLIGLEKNSRKLTAFVGPDGYMYEFLKMPYGLLNTSVVFQNFIFKILYELVDNKKIFLQQKRIIIPTKTWEENYSTLKSVLRLLAKVGLELRTHKCSFFQKEMTHQGYKIKKSEAKPNKKFINPLANYPFPKTAKQLQDFLQVSDYFKDLIPNYKLLVSSLTSPKFHLGQQPFQAFETLKKTLLSPPVLSVFQSENSTELHVNSSKRGFGGILMQKQQDGLFHPVFYLARRRTKVEFRAPKLQAEAVLSTFQHFRNYLRFISFTLITDFLVKRNLQSFDYKVDIRSTRHVRFLSWSPSNVEKFSFEETLVFHQLQDPSIKEIKSAMKNTVTKYFEIVKGVLYRKQGNSLLLCVPGIYIGEILRKYHDDLGHPNVRKTVNWIFESYWFPDRRIIVEDYVEKCCKCVLDFGIGRAFDTLLVNFWDFKGQKVLAILDYHTKYLVLHPVEVLTSTVVGSYLGLYFRHFGLCQKLVTCDVSYFRSREFSEFLRKNGITHLQVSGNYGNELFMSIFSNIFERNSFSWNLLQMQMSINDSYSIELLVNFLKKPIRVNIGVDSEKIFGKWGRIEVFKGREKTDVDVCLKGKFGYCEGDFVVVKVMKGRKFVVPKYNGPFRVRKIVSSDSFFVEDIEGLGWRSKPFCRIVHEKVLKFWVDHVCCVDE